MRLQRRLSTNARSTHANRPPCTRRGCAPRGLPMYARNDGRGVGVRLRRRGGPGDVGLVADARGGVVWVCGEWCALVLGCGSAVEVGGGAGAARRCVIGLCGVCVMWRMAWAGGWGGVAQRRHVAYLPAPPPLPAIAFPRAPAHRARWRFAPLHGEKAQQQIARHFANRPCILHREPQAWVAAGPNPAQPRRLLRRRPSGDAVAQRSRRVGQPVLFRTTSARRRTACAFASFCCFVSALRAPGFRRPSQPRHSEENATGYRRHAPAAGGARWAVL